MFTFWSCVTQTEKDFGFIFFVIIYFINDITIFNIWF